MCPDSCVNVKSPYWDAPARGAWALNVISQIIPLTNRLMGGTKKPDKLIIGYVLDHVFGVNGLVGCELNAGLKQLLVGE